MTETNAQGSLLAQQYLADLERALTGADPREREETLAAVRERIEEVPDGDAASVRSVLAGAVLALLGIAVQPFLAIPVAVAALALGIVQARRRDAGRGIAVSTIVVASVALLWAATLAMLFIPVSTEISGGELTTSDPMPASTAAPASP